MEVQIQYFERQIVLTNLKISKHQDIPILKIQSVGTIGSENVNPDISKLDTLAFAMDSNDINYG